MTAKQQNPILDELRTQIDEIDAQLIRLIALRMDKVREIGSFKKKNGVQILSEKRRQTVNRRWLRSAKMHQLSPDFIHALYSLIHEHALQVETDVAEFESDS